MVSASAPLNSFRAPGNNYFGSLGSTLEFAHGLGERRFVAVRERERVSEKREFVGERAADPGARARQDGERADDLASAEVGNALA